MRLTPMGLLRWYAGCCNTPIGNMVSARVPFIGIVHMFMGDSAPGWSVIMSGAALPAARTIRSLAILERGFPRIGAFR